MSSGEEPKETSSVGELMQEVKRRAEQRKREGLYAGADDSPPFVEEALRDDLAAAANRVAAAARIPSIVPDLPVPAPHDNRNTEPDEVAEDSDKKAETTPGGAFSEQAPSASELIFKVLSYAGNKAFRVVAGDRVDRFIEGSTEFFQATAAFSREVAERILTLERRIEALEEAKSRRPSRAKKPESSRKRRSK